MRKIALLLVLSFVFFGSIAQSDKQFDELDKTLNNILEISQAPGFAVAVVKGDEIIYQKGFGYRDYEKKKPVDVNTLFAIGSTTKAFTSGILGQLRADDKLTFDDSPIDYIPELKFYNNEMNNNIIIKDLMCHRTGLPRHDLSWYFFPTKNRDSLLLRLKYHEPFAGLREKWYYNNYMFLAQGVIAERITNKSWEENIEERFFEPLGMKRSNTSIEALEKSSNAAYGYKLKNDSIIRKMDYYDIAAMSPAGSINSSVNEMSNWLITWINKGEFKGKTILPQTYVDEAISSQMVINGSLPDEEFPDVHFANYGYGWSLSSYKGHYRVGHGGNIDGFSANVTFFPSDSIGIVVFANQNGSAVPNIVRNIMSDYVLDVRKTDWEKRFKERKEKTQKEAQEAQEEALSTRVKNTNPSHILIDYTGTYHNDGYGTFEIKLENDSLYADFKRLKLYLKHYHYNIFEPHIVEEFGLDTVSFASLLFNFTTNNLGDISAVKIELEPTLDPIVFKRSPNSIEVDLSTLESYVGEYELSGLVIKIYIKNDNTLHAFVKGQPEYELTATAQHKFSLKALEGFKIEFLETEDKSINELLMIQPNGTFKAKRK